MIITKELKTLEDFKNIAKGDILACEWHRDVYEGNKRLRFQIYTVVNNKETSNEIILNKKFNTYFNYDMFLSPDESSNLKSAILIKSV